MNYIEQKNYEDNYESDHGTGYENTYGSRRGGNWGMVFAVAAVLAVMFRQWDIFTLIFCLMIAIGIVGRKIPCKDYRIGLQWY